MDWDKIFASATTDRDEFLKYANSPYNLMSEKEQPNQKKKKNEEDLNRHFSKEYPQKANRHMIRRSM